jgi:hypothetical protein
VNYAVGFSPQSVVIADFNGDGKLDLAVANRVGNGIPPYFISILLGNGDGTFQPQVAHGVPDNPSYLAVADFNGDGKPDLAVTQPTDILVLPGKGDGTFGPPVSSPAVVNYYGTPIAVGDLNGDGIPDLVVQGNVLLGNGNFTFRSAPLLPWEGQAAIADFNGDGKPDLAQITTLGVSVSLGNGDGTFNPAGNFLAGNSTWYLTVGNFTGDGKPDVAVANEESDNLSVLLNITP